ncbi:hypothetical protein BSKO_01199 [Bryopsis sp. KO-2023]|nr:hypothetical protein BSKO_01199 [Bryopsis sp. KO-2023]
MHSMRGVDSTFCGVTRNCQSLLARPSTSRAIPRDFTRRLSRNSTRVCCSRWERSYDSEDELNSEYLDELSGRTDPDRFDRFSKRMDLIWSISKRGRPTSCDCCKGSGTLECGFCNGTGVLTIGDVVYCSMTGCDHCPVCKNTVSGPGKAFSMLQEHKFDKFCAGVACICGGLGFVSDHFLYVAAGRG